MPLPHDARPDTPSRASSTRRCRRRRGRPPAPGARAQSMFACSSNRAFSSTRATTCFRPPPRRSALDDRAVGRVRYSVCLIASTSDREQPARRTPRPTSRTSHRVVDQQVSPRRTSNRCEGSSSSTASGLRTGVHGSALRSGRSSSTSDPSAARVEDPAGLVQIAMARGRARAAGVRGPHPASLRRPGAERGGPRAAAVQDGLDRVEEVFGLILLESRSASRVTRNT